jgi:hypothetical protein
MSVDKLLEHLLDAIEAENLWDTEAYAQMVLDRIEEVNEESREGVRLHMENLVERSQAEAKRLKEKEDLINQIVNFRG